MFKFASFLIVVGVLVLAFASDASAQIFRRGGGCSSGGCSSGGGCGVSSGGCNVGSSGGCNIGSSGGCNIASNSGLNRILNRDSAARQFKATAPEPVIRKAPVDDEDVRNQARKNRQRELARQKYTAPHAIAFAAPPVTRDLTPTPGGSGSMLASK